MTLKVDDRPSRRERDAHVLIAQREEAERGPKYTVAAVVITAAAALAEFAMGRLPLCRCGYLKLWHGVVYSSENSQHLTDWYTFTHVLHGLGFYVLLWLALRRFDAGLRFVLAVALEAAWEVAENTPLVIDRYRAATISSITMATALSIRLPTSVRWHWVSGSLESHPCGPASPYLPLSSLPLP